LRVERIDLLYIHRPDLLTHPGELAQTLDGLVSSGKVAAVGVSNFNDRSGGRTFAIHEKRRFASTSWNSRRRTSIRCSTAPWIRQWRTARRLRRGRRWRVDAWVPQTWQPHAIPVCGERSNASAEHTGVPPAAVALAFLHRHPAPGDADPRHEEAGAAARLSEGVHPVAGGLVCYRRSLPRRQNALNPR